MTEQTVANHAVTPSTEPRRVFAIELDDELYLFERALHAERFAYATRTRGPRTLGTVRVLDDVAAQQLLAQLLTRG